MTNIQSQGSVLASSRQTGANDCPNGPGQRILVVTEKEGSTGERGAAMPRQIQGFDVDHACIEDLDLSQGLQACGTSRPMAGTASTEPQRSLPMLGKYALILVPTAGLRLNVCEALPSLAERVYQIDHFCASSAHEHHSEHDGTNPGKDAQKGGLDHWSACLSQLAV